MEGGELYKEHLGGGIYVSIDEKYHGVSLRRHWMPPGQDKIVQTKQGIYLPAAQWVALKQTLNELLAAFPGLNDAVPCIYSHEGNQMGLVECKECMPFGWAS